MRIITGKRRGMKLYSPAGDETRPTESRIKESIFNILGNVSDSICIDLFAGSGAIGLEFLSRGSEFVFFVENNKNALKTLKSNLDKSKFDNYKLIEKDYALSFDYFNEYKIDYIYIDPPYDRKDYYQKSLGLILQYKNLEDSLIIIEANNKTEIPLDTDEASRL